jgi:Cu/Ag efflux protein CusF
MIRLPSWMLVVLAMALLIGLTAPVLADEAQGKIKSVSADKNQFVLTDTKGKDWTFDLDAKATVRVNDRAGKFNDLKAGDEVTITYNQKGDKLIAREVRAKRTK